MKLLLSLAAMFAVVAQAEVKPVGTVLNSQCGEAVESPARAGGFKMNRICKASVVGQKTEYIAVEESIVSRRGMQSQTTLWEITGGVENATTAVLTVTESGYKDGTGLYQPKVATSMVTGKITVKLQPGTTVYGEMTGELGGRKFTAGGFEGLFHTQSAGPR